MVLYMRENFTLFKIYGCEFKEMTLTWNQKFMHHLIMNYGPQQQIQYSKLQQGVHKSRARSCTVWGGGGGLFQWRLVFSPHLLLSLFCPYTMKCVLIPTQWVECARKHWGSQVAPEIWVLRMELASCRPPTLKIWRCLWHLWKICGPLPCCCRF